MINKIRFQIKKNTEIVALSLLIIVTIVSTTYYNFSKTKIYNNYKNTINNVYLKKTFHHFFNNLEPKFKKINHRISSGETFDNILERYSVKKDEVADIKKKLSKKVNLNKLNTNQKIEFTIDQKNNLVKEFVFKISNTEKIHLSRDIETDEFNQKILVTRLSRDIVYKENIILESLYKSAVQKKFPANIIIEISRIYGYQVYFQRDIRERDTFQIMYEIFSDENNKIIETGNILYANLKLSRENNELYFFDKKK